jgi:HSP20 family protein
MIVSNFDTFPELDRFFSRSGSTSALPLPMDVIRRSHEVLVNVDLPGVRLEDLELTVERNILTLTAERRDPVAEGDRYVTRERRSGRVSRQLVLSDALDASNLEASLSDGVLRLRIPVAEQAKAQRIEITAGAPSPAIEASAN